MHAVVDLIRQFKQALRFGEQYRARLGEFDPAARPCQQLDIELSLERLNVLRERGLGDMQALRGAPEVQFLCHHDEIAKAA
ncbi:hypothetical protein ASD34_22265 [Variovorax sp. Root473]|nr:hypothetical protein ASD34_22265 [Variovorax sp. Root473]